MNLDNLAKKLKGVVKNLLSINRRIPAPAINKGILFIHIPKAAGSSISLELYGVQISHCKIEEYISCDRNRLSSIKKFSIVRNPIDRFISAYDFLCNGGMIED
ncbi:sulfotransferase family 2 domain-containing protein, partial [Photobacterium sp. BZF1]|uniref:sulfotransferase family 2 domain-containing protein n=1 Tax=Photobacterium sp. BZF1 TaxID=1904457 RepID=UPI001653C96C